MLFKLQFGVDPHIADLTVEGAFLSIGVCVPASLLPTGLWNQTRVRLNGAQSAAGFQNGFVFSAFIVGLQLGE